MNQLYLIDYGICVPFRDSEGQHIKFEENVAFRGNVIFSSKNALMEYSLSRRDDIISMCYMLAFFLNTNFRWIEMQRPVKQQMEKVRDFKNNASARRFLERSARCLTSLLKYAYELKFDEAPDYSKLRYMLVKTLLKHDEVPHYKFDWSYDHPDAETERGGSPMSSAIESLAPGSETGSRIPSGVLSGSRPEEKLY